jgi:CarboxypepD_reg-like domain
MSDILEKVLSMGRLTPLLVFCFTDFCFAQTVKGFVLDQETQQPVPYVNIGIVNKNVGTVLSENGAFEIRLDAKYDMDSICFSCIGYDSRTFLMEDFRKRLSSGKITISLIPKAIALQEVIVTSEAKKTTILGHAPKSKFTKAGFFYNRLGHEIGTLFESENSSPKYLDSVQLNFVNCHYDSIFLRLNVYSIDGERVENILPQNVFINLTKKKALENPMINLTPYNLLVGNKYLVSIEIVKDLGELGLKFYAALKADRFPTLYRGTSQDKWETVYHKSKPVGISIMTYSH